MGIRKLNSLRIETTWSFTKTSNYKAFHSVLHIYLIMLMSPPYLYYSKNMSFVDKQIRYLICPHFLNHRNLEHRLFHPHQPVISQRSGQLFFVHNEGVHDCISFFYFHRKTGSNVLEVIHGQKSEIEALKNDIVQLTDMLLKESQSRTKLELRLNQLTTPVKRQCK